MLSRVNSAPAKRLTLSCVFAVSGVVALAACVGSDPAPASAEPGANDAGVSETGVPNVSPDAAPSLGCPLGCLPPAPAGGWKGPAAVYDGAEAGKPTACPSPYTALEVDAHQNMTAPLSCSCGTPTFAGQKCTTNVVWWASAGCPAGEFGVVNGITNPGAVCSSNDSTNYKSVVVEKPLPEKGTCSFPSPAFDIPAPAFEKVDVACGLPQAAACEARADCVATPVPEQPFTRLCIYKDGDEPCPSLDYTARFLAHKKVEDDRACSPCSDPVADATCTDTFGFSAPGACGVTAPTDRIANGACLASPGAGQRVNGGAIQITNATCTTNGGKPSGSAKSSDPVTFCCNK